MCASDKPGKGAQGWHMSFSESGDAGWKRSLAQFSLNYSCVLLTSAWELV